MLWFDCFFMTIFPLSLFSLSHNCSTCQSLFILFQWTVKVLVSGQQSRVVVSSLPSLLCVWQEGKQASLAADFSVTQFKHLGRLLMVHGRNSYKRSAALSQFVIHRSLCISTMQVLYLYRTSWFKPTADFFTRLAQCSQQWVSICKIKTRPQNAALFYFGLRGPHNSQSENICMDFNNTSQRLW